MSITRAQGEANLKSRVERFYEPAIKALGLPLTQDMFDALCSLTWNLGVGILGAEHDVGRLLRERKWLEAANAMLEYDRAGGVVLAGLRTRREGERRLFLSALPVVPFVPADEQRWCREFDAGRISRVRRRAVVRAMRSREHKLEEVAHSQKNGWTVLNRRARFQALKGRSG